MLFDPRYVPYWSIACLLFTVFLWSCAGHACRVNARRAAAEPDKRNFHFIAIFLAPFTWPLFLIVYSALFFIKVILYSAFLFLVIFALIVIRKPFLLIWLDKIAIRVGNRLLEANTFLIKVFFGIQVEDSKT